MSKYAYPAVFTLEEDGTYSIIFPDLEGCYTCGDSLEDGCLLYTSPSPRDRSVSRMPSSA